MGTPGGPGIACSESALSSIISNLYAPSWTVDRPSVTDAIETALRELGCSVQCRRKTVDNRSVDILEKRYGSLLGYV